MIRSTSNMALMPSARGAYKRSRIAILASSKVDRSWARHYGVGNVDCQDDSYSLMVSIRLMVRRMVRPPLLRVPCAHRALKIARGLSLRETGVYSCPERR